MKQLRLNLIWIAAIGMIFFTSCKKDIEGCTDPMAENYNPDANISIENCVYPRDKFIGSFSGKLDCQAPLSNEESFTVLIVENPDDLESVLIEFKDVDAPLPELEAKVDSNRLYIEPKLVSVPLDMNNPDLLTKLEYSGEATIDGDDLQGEIITKVIDLFITLKCDITATRD